MTGIVDFRAELLDENGLPITDSNPLSTTGGGGVDAYLLNDFIDGEPQYIGKAKADGTWLIQRFSTTGGAMRYANVSNNTGLAYDAAWSSRTTLNYVLFQQLVGV
jgi:hypothetical protein